MKIRKKKGFTLIELMIVLAIIAILAVVLIPKSQIFKSNAKASGVLTNVNTVQAYLETKTEGNFTNSASTLQQMMSNNFSTTNNGDVITNPYNSSTTISTTNGSISVLVLDSTITTSTSFSDPAVNSNIGSTYAGEVIVYVNGSQYIIYGVDGGGNITKVVTIKK